MQSIEIGGRTWTPGDEIGEGGFGHVFRARAGDGSEGALKFVPKTRGADRELLFESVTGIPNVIPILETAETTDFLVLLMPLAEESLRQHLRDHPGPMPLDDAIRVLMDIADALRGLDAAATPVVHRDIKPENVLLYNGHWCLCDFGIARYAEASTSADTRKFMMTREYAAPEQWREERATPATDIYGLGVLAFELVEGQRPFLGPSVSEYREQHLHQAPPALMSCPASLSSLITECLFKPSQARPTAANVAARLQMSVRPSSPAAQKLQAMNRDVVSALATEVAAESAARTEAARRQGLLDVASATFQSLVGLVHDAIAENAPAATIGLGVHLHAKLGDGELYLEGPKACRAGALALPRFASTIDVICYSRITIAQARGKHGHRGRSHSLWYCDAQEQGVYRWYELAFMPSLSTGSFAVIPFDCDPSTAVAFAFGMGGGEFQLAWQPIAVDQGAEAQFVDRWIGWLADASANALELPRYLPEQSGGFHRPPLRT